jgi:hypothetical protein
VSRSGGSSGARSARARYSSVTSSFDTGKRDPDPTTRQGNFISGTGTVVTTRLLRKMSGGNTERSAITARGISMANDQRHYPRPPVQVTSPFARPAVQVTSPFVRTLGALAIAVGVGALGAYMLDLHGHTCVQCGRRWRHFGAFNFGDEQSHTCTCGQVQWWKCGVPHVLRGSQFVTPLLPIAPRRAPPVLALPFGAGLEEDTVRPDTDTVPTVRAVAGPAVRAIAAPTVHAVTAPIRAIQTRRLSR